MTVGQLIEKLSTLDKSLPVVIADWNEKWTDPDERITEDIEIVDDCCYWNFNSKKVIGKAVCIGGS